MRTKTTREILTARHRPKTVIIDGIHYAPVDATDASAISAEMRGKRALRLQAEVDRMRAEVERLRLAIAEHRKTVEPGDDYCGADIVLWRVLDA